MSAHSPQDSWSLSPQHHSSNESSTYSWMDSNVTVKMEPVSPPSPYSSPRHANAAPTMSPPPYAYSHGYYDCSPPHMKSEPDSSPIPSMYPSSPSMYSQEPEKPVKVPENNYQLEEDQLEQIRQLAVQQAAQDVQRTCHILNISPNPYTWSVRDVQSWIVWTQQQYGCPPIPQVELVFSTVTGQTLCSWTEMEFRTIACPETADTICAQLEIWKTAASSNLRLQDFRPDESVMDISSFLGCSPMMYGNSNPQQTPTDDSEDEEEMPAVMPTYGPDNTPVPTRRVGGATQHIHLWQFLKELLNDSATNGSCIRWLDRSKGVFKIEDSVRVARLWGRRKNRPAMNYDKLSRSIRQYYRKGIMRKTERSQRLVYQFCAPYAA